MTYYCQLILDNNPSGGYVVDFPDMDNVFTQGDNKEHALAMAKEVLNLMLNGTYEEDVKLPLPVDRSDEGLFPIEVNPQIAKRILESKIKALQDELKIIEKDIEISTSIKNTKSKMKTPSLAH